MSISTTPCRVWLLSALLCAVCSLSSGARVIEIRSSRCGTPVSQGILARLAEEKPTERDTVVLFFDQKGDIVLNRTIETRCHTEIKGLGEKKTRVLAREELRPDGSTTLGDDCFIAVKGRRRGRLAVNIHDINISLAKHKGLLWERSTEKLLIKIYDADKVNVTHFTSHCDNAVCTNLDLRGCSNVEVSECTFENYNNCRISGCLWMRGAMDNVKVHDCKFYKHGNDEILAFWEDPNHGKTNNQLSNIEVRDNEFYYVNAGGVEDMPIDIMFNLGGTESDRPYTVKNLRFIDNSITLDAPAHTVIGMDYNKNGKGQGIEVSGNTITSTAKRHTDQPGSFQFDFDIRLPYLDMEHPIVITGNHIVSEAHASNQWSECSGYVLNHHGGYIEFTDNEVTSSTQLNFEKAMVRQGVIKVEGNTFEGLAGLASISELDSYKLEATGNRIDGKSSSIYSHNVVYGEYIFERNECRLTDYALFLNEMPANVSVSYCGNDVTCTEHGVLFSNYSGKTGEVEKLQVENNIFRGVGNSDPTRSLGSLRPQRSSIRANQIQRY